MSSRNCKFSRRHFLNIFDIYYNPSTYITQVICKRTVGGTIISIRNNRLALFLKLFQIIDDFASEKCCSIFQCRLVNNYNIPLHSHPICAFAHTERILPFQSRKCLQIFFGYFCFDIFYFIRIYECHAASFKSCS